MRTRRGGSLTFVLLLLATPIGVRGQQLPIKTYTTAEGLPHNTVNRIVKDSHGFLWFCTSEGLARFDGYGFTTFGIPQGLPNALINDLLETRSGDYWVATGSGLVRFDPHGRPGGPSTADDKRAGHSAPMFSIVPAVTRDSRATAATTLREARDGTIWVGTANGLHRLAKGPGGPLLEAVDIKLPNDNPEQRMVADVLDDATGSLWIAAPSGLYRRWPDGSSARYTEADGLPNGYLQDLLEDHDGHLWAATRLGGFFRFTADASRRPPAVDSAYTLPALPASWVFQLFETSAHRFWIATARGLAEFLPDGDNARRHFRIHSTRNGLSYQEITALAEDDAGNLWLGTNNAGAMKLALNGVTAFNERDGLRQVSDVFNDRAGNLCFRAIVLGNAAASVFEGARLDLVSMTEPVLYQRVGCFDGRQFVGFRPASIAPLAWGWVSEGVTVQTRRGEWWIGTGRGLYRFPAAAHLDALRTSQPLAVYTPKNGLTTWQIYRLFEDSRGDVWVSGVGPDVSGAVRSSHTNGLARWDHVSGRIIDVAGSPGLPSLEEALPRAFGEDDSGNVWIGFDGRLARYRDGFFRMFAAADGVPAGAIRDIFRDTTGHLWLASAASGVVRVDDAAGERPVFRAFTTAEGMSSNDIQAITDDLQGHIYAAGGRGLDRLAPATGHIKHFTTADGLGAGIFRNAFRDRSGVLWFGTTTGLTRVTPIPENVTAPPPVLISAVRIDNVPTRVSALGEQTISLGQVAQEHQVQIEFVGLGFASGERLQYQYRLQATDGDWSAPSEKRSVTYASLAPGDYRFVVRAVNSDGLSSAQPATIAFRILTPIWQRAWFLGLAALGVSLLLYRLYRYRVARLLEIANLRMRIATDLHDDIGANLTRIALLSQVAAQAELAGRPPVPEPSREGPEVAADGRPLVAIARIARESVGSMSDIVWAINPARETLRDLTRRMRQHADEIFTLRNIELRFEAPEVGHDLRLAVDVRRDVLLIFKECVNNSARHSGCRRVDIDFRVERSRLWLRVSDDGAGFETSSESQGQGLTSMQRRARRLGAEFRLESGSGRGTTMTLAVPL